MKNALHTHLSKRESQVMDVVYRLGEAPVADVVAQMPEGVSYHAVRVTLNVLERKGHLLHRRDGHRYIYYPTVSHDQARRSLMSHVVKTFFNGSSGEAILALLGMTRDELTENELQELSTRIEHARREQSADEAEMARTRFGSRGL